jgi:hypothetical protein
MVREKRLELLHLAALEPKSSASTNSATRALFHYNSMVVAEMHQLCKMLVFYERSFYYCDHI